LIAAPGAPLIAIGIWWNSNTISHNFCAQPVLRSRLLNRGFLRNHLAANLETSKSHWAWWQCAGRAKIV